MFTITKFEMNLQRQMETGWVPEMVVSHGGGGSVSSSQGRLHLWTRYIDGLLGHTKKLET